MNRKPIKTQDVVVMYEDQHLSLRAIGAIVGLSGAGVRRRLNKAGVNTAKGRRIPTDCAFCGKDLALRRCEIKRSRKHYCHRDCYFADIENAGGFKPWRHGMRLARAVVSQHYRIPPDAVVHHVDGNNRNNNLDNLSVYASNSDHLSAHRGGKALPIWEGKKADITYHLSLALRQLSAY